MSALLEAPPVAPTDSLIRSAEFRAEASADGLTLDGYAAVFGAETTIDSWEGRFREQVAPGAFKRSLGQRVPILQFDHGQHPLIGSLPIGAIRNIAEDARGLKVRARLSDNWLVEPVRDAIRDGAITGMSFRFRVIDEMWTELDADLPLRTITQVELFEVGPVVWPAYEATSVGVRSRDTLTALQDPEVRAELARILASGTDLASLATLAPASRHADDSTDSPPEALGVPPFPAGLSRSKRVALALTR